MANFETCAECRVNVVYTADRDRLVVILAGTNSVRNMRRMCGMLQNVWQPSNCADLFVASGIIRFPEHFYLCSIPEIRTPSVWIRTPFGSGHLLNQDTSFTLTVFSFYIQCLFCDHMIKHWSKETIDGSLARIHNSPSIILVCACMIYSYMHLH